MTTELVELREGDPQWQAFQRLPAAVYSGDPHYIPEDPEEAVRRFGPARQRALLVLVDGEPAARLIACLQDVRGATQEPCVGLIGYFEALNVPHAVAPVFDAACSWFRSRGVRRVLGPMNGDTWHRYRLNVGPFDSRPFLMEPYNPAYYPVLWETAGFGVAQRYYSKCIDDPGAAAARMRRFTERVRRNGFSMRALDPDRFEQELRLVHELSTRTFSNNPLYTDIAFEEFLALYQRAKPLIRPEHVLFASSPEGQPVGFVFSFPDCFEAVRTGDLSVPADTLNLKTVGVIPAYQRTGLGPALMAESYKLAHDAGYRRINLCLIHEQNVSGRLDAGLGHSFRHYCLYRKQLNAREDSRPR